MHGSCGRGRVCSTWRGWRGASRRGPLLLVALVAFAALVASSAGAAPDPAEILFLDERAGLPAAFFEAAGYEVVRLRPDVDGVQQIGDTLRSRRGVAVVHLFGHGAPGVVQIGSTVLTPAGLRSRATELRAWRSALAPGADLWVHGCRVAEGPAGLGFVRTLARITGADVAASDDPTGSERRGGDWELEVRQGALAPSGVPGLLRASGWDGLLAVNTFQEGASGYTGTQDTELHEDTPSTNLGNATTMEADAVDGGSGGQQQILLRFDNLIGAGAGQIPAGAVINSATLTVEVTDPTVSGAAIRMHRMLVAWTEASTWNSMGGGVQLNGVEASVAAASTLSSPQTSGSRTFTGLAATVQAWADGAANYGWVIVNDNEDNWIVRSSETGTVGQRPLLTVDWSPPTSDLTLAKTDSPDPAAAGGSLVYTLLVTNTGPSTATGVTVTDTLPASVTLVSATPSQGSCSGTTVVTCNLGAIVNSGTASVEILVTTSSVGTIVNNASVTANEVEPTPANNAVAASTDIVTTSFVDVPLTLYRRIYGFLDHTVTGGTLRTQPNQGGNPCLVGASSSANLSGIPVTATVVAAYLYWAGSGSTVDSAVTFDGSGVTADRTFQSRFVNGSNTYDFFSGFEDVTAQVQAKRNGLYSFSDLTVATGNPYCGNQSVLAGWALLAVYEDTSLPGQTLVLYDGFDVERNGSTSFLLTGIWAADPPEAKTTFVVWEGDDTLGGTAEKLEFNGTPLSDGLNPVNNVYNGTINSLGVTTSYGVDIDTFDVSSLVSAGDTLATSALFTGPDLVLLNVVVLQAKSNIIVGTVFEDVNYGGGGGRNLATAIADAPGFTVPRPGAVVELYDAAGTMLRTTTTGANGLYGFAGLVDGDYRVRVVNESVDSSRPGATGAEWPVQTYRTDASGGSAVPVSGAVGGADPDAQDSPANVGMVNLGTLTAQSVAPARVITGVAVPDVDFGFNFDTVVNTNNAGQGSLRSTMLNANVLTNAGLAQDGLAPGVEHSLFMIPSDSDPWGRPPDPGFDAGRGVARIALTSLLPALTDASTAIDGTTQTTHVGDTNAALVGTGGTVGLGADARLGTGDDPLFAQLAGPEIEIVDGAALDVGLDLQANGGVVRGIAIYGFGSTSTNTGNVRAGSGMASNFTGLTIEDNVIGAPADVFSDPDLSVPGSGTEGCNVVVRGADGGALRDNRIGYGGRGGARFDDAADDWTIERNEIRRNAIDVTRLDGLAFGASTTRATVTENVVADNQGAGIDFYSSLGAHVVRDNTIEQNGWGGDETAGVRMFGTDSLVERNVLRDNTGSGVLATVLDPGLPAANSPALRNRVTRNYFSGNGSNAIDLQVSLDLLAPGDGVTLNDGTLLGDGSVAEPCGKVASHGNEGLDTPVIDLAIRGGATSTVRGRACPGAEVELYRAVGGLGDAQGGGDYGEGVEYLGTLAAHGVTGAFESSTVTGLAAGDAVSAIAIDSDDNTSEFALNVVTSGLTIVKRAFQLDGTPVASGASMPVGMPIRFLVYVSNPGAAVSDLTLADVLDPTFAYQAGTLRADNSLASSVACPGGVCDEASILSTVVSSGTPVGDGDSVTPPIDADSGSYDGGAATVHVGNGGNPANAALDIAADSVWAIVFTVRVQ